MSQFINPFTDFGFKRIFGQESNKRLLIGFLNALFEGEFVVQDLEYRDKEILGDSRQDRCVIYDIYCTLDDGRHFILEMQNQRHTNFDARALYYLARAIYAQGQKGDDWNYEYCPVFGIYFMNYKEKLLGDAYRADYGIIQTQACFASQTQSVPVKDASLSFANKLRMIFLQMPQFTLEESKCRTELEKWMYIMNHLDKLPKIPWAAQNELFEELSKVSNVAALSHEERVVYDELLRQYRDNIVIQQASIEDGIEIGIEIGEKRGIEIGEKRGIEITKVNIARQLKQAGIDMNRIAQSTGLSLEDVEKL